ncbi:hypothetical protein DL96DRAFT_1602800 [Flagelloscypha sp. PMI_526]|nr:hypothetical protein DL96DRAFT_1602800 [Flagelloscypha sp. PMI_526]
MSSQSSNSPPSDMTPTSQQTPPEPDGGRTKKRRTPGSCDHCRKRKAKCDSANQPGNRCTRCSQMGLDCTHDGVLKNLGSAKTYVENMESRLEKVEKILAKVRILEIAAIGLTSHLFVRCFPDVNLATDLDDLYQRVVLDPSCHRLERNDDDSEEARLAGRLNYLKLAPSTNRFWGRSSNFMFLETAMRAKDEEHVASQKSILNTHKRPEFWSQRAWQIPPPPTSHPPPYEFPDIRLIFELTDLYFTRVNDFFPLLHRPTFENLHHRDRGFGATVLLVIAMGSRYSNDPRIFLEDIDDEHSAGWPFIRQFSFMWADGWISLGVAIRRAIEPLSFGRPVALDEEHFDIEYPIECDDEYWEVDFKQPEGKPSKVSMFNGLLRLSEIQAHVLRTVYKTKKHRFSPVIASQQQFISSLDSAMNKWIETEVPRHLQLQPHNESWALPLFRQQSAYLYVNYYALQLYIHKPFIPLSDSPSIYPSLAISTNAARALLHVLSSGEGDMIARLPSMQAKAWIAGMILLIHIWSGIRSGLAPNPQKDMADVTKCMRLLKKAEARYQMSGKLGDVLAGLAVAGEVNLPKPEKNPATQPRTPSSVASPTISSPASILTELVLSRLLYPQFNLPSLLSQTPIWQDLRPPAPDLNNPLSWLQPADLLAGAPGSSTEASSATAESSHFQPLNPETFGLWSAIPSGFNMYDWSKFVDANSQTQGDTPMT